MLEDDKEEDGGLDPAFGPSSAAGATSQASAAAVRAAAGADQGRRGGGALPGMEARMEEGWTTMRLAERKLLRSPRNLASSAQGPPPPRRPALAAGWTSAAGAGAGDMERPVEPKGHRRSEENGPERSRRRGTPTHPPARRSPASPLRFAPALLLTPRSLLSPPPGEESLPAPPLPPHPCCPPPPHPLVQVSTLEANLGQGPWRDVVGSLLAQLMDVSPSSPPRRSGFVAEQGGDNGVNPRDRVSAWPPRPRGGGGGRGAGSGGPVRRGGARLGSPLHRPPGRHGGGARLPQRRVRALRALG